jgi:iron-sulfur cluster repair protein YtfE (RIC family)
MQYQRFWGESFIAQCESNPAKTMLNQIKAVSAKNTEQDVTELLLGCHQRIRHFGGVAVRLAQSQGASNAEIAQAADGLYRYFSEALPLHEADENLSIHPRLRRALPKEELAGPAADAMVDQHQTIDELVERLLPLWVVTRANPEKLSEVAGEMCEIAGRLQEVFDSHLKMEEETIFPALRKYLSSIELQEIADEMQARRRSG